MEITVESLSDLLVSSAKDRDQIAERGKELSDLVAKNAKERFAADEKCRNLEIAIKVVKELVDG